MKKLLLTLALCMGYLCTTVAQTFVKTEVKQSMRRVADWQIAHYNKAIYGDLILQMAVAAGEPQLLAGKSTDVSC